jgi:hypothetical protein
MHARVASNQIQQIAKLGDALAAPPAREVYEVIVVA